MIARLPRPAVLALVVLATRLPGLVGSQPFNTDETTLALGGRTLRDGGALYVDFFDRKPPLPFGLYALVGTGDLRWVRLLIAVLVLGAALVIASEGDRRWGRRAGWVAGLVVVLGAAALDAQDAQAANFELFALLPIAVAAVAAARRRPVLAGVALAFAVLCKQPAAITAIPVAWVAWRTGRWRSLAITAASGAVATAVLAAPFGISGVIEWSLLGTGGYLAAGGEDLTKAAVRLLALLAICGGFWSGAWLLVVGRLRGGDDPSSAAGTGDDDTPPTPDPALGWRGVQDVDLWLLLAVSAAAMLPGLRLFPHYLIQLLPALALLAGSGAARSPKLLRPALALGIVASLVAAATAWNVVATPAPAWQTDVAAAIQHRTSSDDRVLVWGNAPEILWAADRLPAGGYPHSEFFTGYSGGRVARASTEANVPDPDLYESFLDALADDPPALVVDTAAADRRGGRWFPLDNFDRLARFVAEYYRRVGTVDGVVIYELQEAAAP